MQTTTIKTFGNVTKDFQTRTGKNNRTYTAFAVAINPEEGGTQFLRCFSWGNQAHFAKKLTKGVRVQITGQSSERITPTGPITFVRTEFIRSFERKAVAA
jgi:single-stranded DNA-binding protein